MLPAQAVVRNPSNEPVVWIKSGAERFIPQPVKFRPLDAQNVVVIGGGDTGADCIGTARRQGLAVRREDQARHRRNVSDKCNALLSFDSIP